MICHKALLIFLILSLTYCLVGCASDEPEPVEGEAAGTEIAAELPDQPVQVRETVIDLQPSQATGPQTSLFSPNGDTALAEDEGPVEIEFVGAVVPTQLEEPQTPAIDLETDIEAVRFAILGVNFELPLGWEAVTLGTNAQVLRPIGAETIFEGPTNTSAYIYIRLVEPTDPTKPLGSELERMRASLGGVEAEESPVSPILDGVRSGGQFVEGGNDALHYRAFLTVILLTESQVVELIFWGNDATWATLGPQMARVLETIRLPEG